jgi:hypothetical protein
MRILTPFALRAAALSIGVCVAAPSAFAGGSGPLPSGAPGPFVQVSQNTDQRYPTPIPGSSLGDSGQPASGMPLPGQAQPNFDPRYPTPILASPTAGFWIDCLDPTNRSLDRCSEEELRRQHRSMIAEPPGPAVS